MISDPPQTLRASLDVLQQKARERTVKTQTVEYDLDTLTKRIDRNSIKLDPDYQRRHRWPAETSSRLIESLILNIPIPVIFISQDIDVDSEVGDDTSRYTVIDGQQRLSAIHDYLRNRFALEGLKVLPELNGIFYKQLPPFLIRRLEERTIRCMRIDSTVDAQVKFDIFERLNTGAVKLEAQELRNATARGPFNDLIKGLAADSDFRSLIQIDLERPESNPKVQKMEDAELVLRFFALRQGRYKELKKGFRDFLTSSQIEFNRLSEQSLKLFGYDFRCCMEFLCHSGVPAPFSKWRFDANKPKKMSNFNAAVFDAVAVGISETFSSDFLTSTPAVAAARLQDFQVLFKDSEFFSSVSGSVNDSAKVSHRIDAMIAYLKK